MTRVSARNRREARQRAGGRCEYCQRHEQTSPFSYNIDHIISEKHGGSSDLANLAWSCVDCNISKGLDVAAYDPDAQALVPLFNPRSQAWHDHFVMQDGRIVGLTPIGRATVSLLQFNEPDRLETRQILIAIRQW